MCDAFVLRSLDYAMRCVCLDYAMRCVCLDYAMRCVCLDYAMRCVVLERLRRNSYSLLRCCLTADLTNHKILSAFDFLSEQSDFYEKFKEFNTTFLNMLDLVFVFPYSSQSFMPRC